MGRFSSSPSAQNLIARIVSRPWSARRAATPCHQIQSRQVNLGRVICRSIHSTTHDLARPSSRRRDLRKKGSVSTRSKLYPIPEPVGRNRIAPPELGRVHPHAMQDDAELTRKGDFGALHATPLCDAERPAFQARKANRTCQHDMGRFKERGSHHAVADLADAAITVSLARLIFFRRQSEIGAYCAPDF